MVQTKTQSLYAIRAKQAETPDRWFHITCPVQDDNKDILKQFQLAYETYGIRYITLTQHDESCTSKSLSSSVTKHPHYHAIVWFFQPKTSKQVAKIFKLPDWKTKDGKSHYYCQPKYATSTMSGFINYVTKYTALWEAGAPPLRVIQERTYPTDKPQTTDSERRMSTAINWVRKGLDETYRKMDPVHYTRNYAKIKSLWGIQQQFTKDKREFVNYWIYGPPGTGKSAVLAALWPGAYALRDQYWDGFNPRSDAHRVVTLKDINSKWVLDYGITQLKTLTDKDGHNINVKYAGGEVVNHARIIVTSNHSIYDCVAGTSKEEIVNLDVEVQALKRRFYEISIDDFLFLAGLKLKPKSYRDTLQGQPIDDYMELFDVVDINGLLGYGQEGYPAGTFDSEDDD